jgi:lipopolysaccharide transport system permease protein
VIEPVAGSVGIDLKELWEYRELVYFMVWRDVKSKYKQSVLGVGWTIGQPVLTAAIFWVIFSQFARLPSDDVPYPLFAFIGLLPWSYFAAAVTRSSTVLVSNSGLVSKVYFPRLILPLAAALVPVIDCALSFVVLGGLMAWYDVMPNAAIVTLPLLLIVAFLTALGIGLWLSALHVKYRDVGVLVPFLIQIWMYASPVIYPLTMVPPRWRQIYSINPMVGVISGFRWALTGGERPDLQVGLISLAAVTLIALGGLWYFRHAEQEMADLI